MSRHSGNLMTDPTRMETDQSHVTKEILKLTLEILCLVTGEKYGVVKMASIECLLQGLYPAMSGEWSRSSSSIIESSSPSMILERTNDKKILEVTQKIVELLTGEVPIRCHVEHVEEHLEGHKDLHQDVMMENWPTLTTPDLYGRTKQCGAIKEESEEERHPDKSDNSYVDCMKVKIVDKGLLGVGCPNYGVPPSPGHFDGSDSEGSTTFTRHNEDTSALQSTSLCFYEEEPLEEKPTAEGGGALDGTRDGAENEDEGSSWPPPCGPEEKMYSCNGHRSIFSSTLDFLQHRSTCRRPPSLACSQYGKGFSNKEELGEHLQVHSWLKPYASSECGTSFRLTSQLVKHQHSHKVEMSGKGYRKGSVQMSTVMEHVGSQSGEKGYSRLEGGEDFSSLVTQDRGHAEEEPLVQTQAKEKPYTCSECGKSFSDSGHLIVHTRTHTGGKPYTCAECGKSFTQNSLLICHQRSHTGVKPYSCSECGKSYFQSGHLTVHKRVHSGEKPHTCPECGKSFYQRSLLIYHQRIHTGERPYACPECGKSFTHRANLAVHQRIHLGEKPFSCSDCGKCFINKWGLINHRRTHTGERPYTCPECGKSFSRSPSLLRHRKVHRLESSFIS